MCIQVLPEKMVIKTGRLQLWKVIRKNNYIGIWGDTYSINDAEFHLGINVAKDFEVDDNNGDYQPIPAQFHCFFTRKDARKYSDYRTANSGFCKPIKIIKVYADSKDVVLIGVDKQTGIPAISVSKMEIKSLDHQR